MDILTIELNCDILLRESVSSLGRLFFASKPYSPEDKFMRKLTTGLASLVCATSIMLGCASAPRVVSTTPSLVEELVVPRPIQFCTPRICSGAEECARFAESARLSREMYRRMGAKAAGDSKCDEQYQAWARYYAAIERSVHFE